MANSDAVKNNSVRIFALLSEQDKVVNKKKLILKMQEAFPQVKITPERKKAVLTYESNIISQTKEQKPIEIYITDDCKEAFNAPNAHTFSLSIFNVSNDCFTREVFKHWKCLYPSQISILLVDNLTDFSSDGFSYDYENKVLQVRKDNFLQTSILRNLLETLTLIPPFFISSGNDQEAEQIKKKLNTYFKKLFPHMRLFYDSKDMKFKQSVSEYMEILSASSYIIFIINFKFLTSIHCMTEFINFSKNNKDNLVQNKIFPIVLDSAQAIYSPRDLADIIKHWIRKKEEVAQKKIELSHHEILGQLNNELKKIDDIIAYIPRMAETIKDLFSLKIEVLEKNNYMYLFLEIDEQIQKDGYTTLYPGNSSSIREEKIQKILSAST